MVVTIAVPCCRAAALCRSETHLEQRDSKANGAEASLAEIEQKESPTATLNHVTQAEDQKALSTNQNPAAPSLTSAEIAGLQVKPFATHCCCYNLIF